MATRDPVIEIHDLRRTFRSRRAEVEAVAGIDLTVKEGEIFGFLGPNGAGKTTTLRILATLLAPTSGQVRVAGYELPRQAEQVRQRIGYVAQQGGSDGAIPGRLELVMQGQLYGMSRASAATRAKELLRAFELEDTADRPTQTYSGGMRRRLDIALGMVHRPVLLFLDEPTTGLDPQSRAHMWDEIRGLRKQGTAVFLTTHYLEEADALCDRLSIIDHGAIIAEGTPDELKQRVAGDAIEIGVSGDPDAVMALLRAEPCVREGTMQDGRVRLYVDHYEAALPQLLRVLDGAGFAPGTVTLSRPSLDDVFLRETGRSLREAGG